MEGLYEGGNDAATHSDKRCEPVLHLQGEPVFRSEERPARTTKEIAKHISAFANAAGGKLVIGIEDDGEVTGFKRSGGATSRTSSAQRAHDPTRRPHRPQGIQSPWLIPLARKTSSSYWTSKASTSHSVAREAMTKFLAAERQEREAQPASRSSPWSTIRGRGSSRTSSSNSSLDDVDHGVLDRYKGIPGNGAPDEQVLRSRRFMRNGRLTVAGALLFAHDPSAMMPQAEFASCARWRQDGDRRAPQHHEGAKLLRAAAKVIKAPTNSSRVCSASSSSWGQTVNSKPCPSTQSSLGSRARQRSDPSRLLVPRRLHPGLDVRRPPGDRQPGTAAQYRDARQHEDHRYSRNPRIALRWSNSAGSGS